MRRFPQSEKEMATVHGIGAFKLKKYGKRFLALFKREETEDKEEENLSAPDRALERKTMFMKLSELRRSLSKKEKKAPFQIFSDNILWEIIERMPEEEKDLLLIKGIGPKKAARYGPVFLEEMERTKKEMALYYAAGRKETEDTFRLCSGKHSHAE